MFSKKSKAFFKIFLWVLIVHVCLTLINEPKNEEKEKKHKIIVKNVILQPKKLETKELPKEVEAKKTKEKICTPKVVSKKPAKKNRLKKKEVKRKAPTKNRKKPDKKLLDALDAQINNLDVSHSFETKTTLDIPSLQTLKIDTAPENVTSFNEDQKNLLATFFKEKLLLPEFGEVKIKFSIDHKGKVQEFEILESKSEKNRKYLKNTLPELDFPCFNETLTIRFYNENN